MNDQSIKVVRYLLKDSWILSLNRYLISSYLLLVVTCKNIAFFKLAAFRKKEKNKDTSFQVVYFLLN